MAPRDYARLHWDWYRDPVLRAVAEQEPIALRVWPVLIAMAKEASHAVDNPSGVIETTWSTIASHCFTDADTVARVMGLLVDGEMVEIDAGRLSVQRVSLARFRDWQVPRSGSGERESKRRERGSSREKGVERDADVSHAPPSSTETETEGISDSLRSSSSAPPTDRRNEDIHRVFDYWCRSEAQTGGHGSTGRKPMLTKDRRTKIHARLVEGFSVQDLQKAIAFYARDPWHLGVNDRRKRYTDLATTLKSGSKVEEGVAGYEQRSGTVAARSATSASSMEAMGYE